MVGIVFSGMGVWDGVDWADAKGDRGVRLACRLRAGVLMIGRQDVDVEKVPILDFCFGRK